MADNLRVAVLGMAHDHLWSNLKDLQDRNDAQLVAGADANPTLRQRFTERTGISTTYEHYEDLLDRETPDAVFAFGATAHHAPAVEACAQRGIHVMLEKPMAATLAEADRILVAARRAGIRLMINWPTAWNAPLRTAYRLTQENAIGSIWQITWRGGHSGPDELGCSEEFCAFLFDKELNGAGAFNDYGGYGASLCVLFMGASPNSVVGMAGRLVKTHLPVDDNGLIIMRYPHAFCRLEMTWTEAVPHQPPHDFVVYGTEGTLVAGREVRLYTRENKAGTIVPVDKTPANQENAAGYFLHCIRNNQDPQSQLNGDLSRAAQEIMEAGLRSATSGMEITLPIEDHLFR